MVRSSTRREEDELQELARTDKRTLCCICSKRIGEYQPDCGHRYCRECLYLHIKYVQKLERRWPPQCTGAEIGLEIIESLLNDEEVSGLDMLSISRAILTGSLAGRVQAKGR